MYIYIYSLNYSTRRGTETKSITWKNNHFENKELKYHQKRAFDIGTKFARLYSNLLMVGLEKIIFQLNR